jgi:hypothetical protein
VFITREQRIAAGAWPTSVVQTEDGPVRIAKPLAGDSLLFRELHHRQENGEDVEKEMVAAILKAGCIDASGKPLMPTMEAARSALDASLSIETAMKLVGAISSLAAPPKESDVNPSVASPSGS